MTTPISLMRGNFYLECGAKVTNSEITTSTINMDGGVITNNGTPTNPGDLATKSYVDTVVGVSNIVVVTLTGTNYSTVVSNTTGAYMLAIKNVVSGGPSGMFSICKNISTNYADPMRMNSSAGITTKERLEINWAPSGPLQLKKTGVNYDGDYTITMVIS